MSYRAGYTIAALFSDSCGYSATFVPLTASLNCRVSLPYLSHTTFQSMYGWLLCWLWSVWHASQQKWPTIWARYSNLATCRPAWYLPKFVKTSNTKCTDCTLTSFALQIISCTYVVGYHVICFFLVFWMHSTLTDHLISPTRTGTIHIKYKVLSRTLLNTHLHRKEKTQKLHFCDISISALVCPP